MRSNCADGCHGDETTPAPPAGLWRDGSKRETSARGVGAHRAHLDGTRKLTGPIACETCHQVPTAVDSPGHMDTPSPAELTFGGLAVAGKVEASWDGARCTVYCHGPGSAAKTGGAHREPEWTKVDGSQVGCDGCHGYPPAGGHPNSTDCRSCHPTAGEGQTIAKLELHIDGTVQVEGGGLGCSACHGSEDNAAPPKDTEGNTEVSARGVGAHQLHVKATALHAPYGCDACHIAPSTVDAPGHTDTALPAEVTFGDIARGALRSPPAGLSPSWNASALTCGSVYCHALDGATAAQPKWTDPQPAACDRCHGLPPEKTLSGGTHPPAALANCGGCHDGVVDASGAIADPVRHADGKLDLSSGPALCSACHGSDNNAAPPVSLAGTSATSERGVGAHQQHLAASTWHAPLSCTDCHLVPAAVNDPGHLDSPLPAELTFSALAKSDGANPAWDGTACNNAYCHGATLSGGTHTAPQWTKVDGSQAACGSCHSLPPTGGGHPNQTDCSTCHGAVVDSSQKIIAPQLHIDGKVQVSSGHPAGWNAGSVHGKAFIAAPTGCGGAGCHGDDLGGAGGPSCNSCHSGWRTNCTFCHGGTDNQTGAPPVTVDGQTAASVPGVGRHSSHVAAGANHAAYGCSLCHANHTDALSPGHIDPSPAEVSFSAPAAGGSYAQPTNSCTVYCHGNGRAGQSGTAVWTGSLTGGCAACHKDTAAAADQMSGEHKKHLEQGYGCNTCHGCVVDGQKQIKDPAKHVNGQRDVCGSALTSYDPVSTSCTPVCHGAETW